jgi:hypothetical protein
MGAAQADRLRMAAARIIRISLPLAKGRKTGIADCGIYLVVRALSGADIALVGSGDVFRCPCGFARSRYSVDRVRRAVGCRFCLRALYAALGGL